MTRSVRVLAAAIAAAVTSAAVQTVRADESGAAAAAVLHNAAGETVGKVAFEETPRGVLVRVDLDGISPGVHGLHVHEHGRCDGPTFESAGGHFAVGGEMHGFFDEAGPHAGDFPNVHVPASRTLSVELISDRMSLSAGERSLFDADGAAVMVHARGDDYRSNPAGDAGDRIACGVIRR